MKSYLIVIIVLAIIFTGCGTIKRAVYSYHGYTVPYSPFLLDSSLADVTVMQCSRAAPSIEGSWNPTPEDIEELENNLGKIKDLTSEGCCLVGFLFEEYEDVDDFALQYVGIIVHGRRLIYINAFPEDELYKNARLGGQAVDFEKEPYIVCDGGTLFWGAVYDPATKEFKELAFNGDS